MNDDQLKVKLEEVANKVLSPNNKHGLKHAIGTVIKFLETVNPGQYDEIYSAMYGPIVSQDNPIMPLEQRLYNLAMRLEAEGAYTDSNICFLALNEMKKINR